MTDDNMALIELLQKTHDSDVLKSVAELTLERLMAFEVEDLCGAAKHERSESRITYRNGDRARALDNAPCDPTSRFVPAPTATHTLW